MESMKRLNGKVPKVIDLSAYGGLVFSLVGWGLQRHYIIGGLKPTLQLMPYNYRNISTGKIANLDCRQTSFAEKM